MRWKFEREDLEAYKCCFCCHVRTGTLILGLVDLLGHAVGLSLFIVAMVHPELVQSILPPLPEKPVHQVAEIGNDAIGRNNSSSQLPQEPIASRDNIQAWVYAKNWNLESLLAAVLLTVASMVIAICLVYGTIRGISKYITPFFCVQMFGLCLSGLTMLSYFSDLPAVRRWIAAQDNLPFKQQLLALDNDHLTLLTLIIFVSTLSIKAYFIGVVWSCYKYLKLHEANGGGQPRVRIYDSEEVHSMDDTEMLLPPKYEDIALMPENQANPPPPAYTPH
jgi:lysosomal-associated transmembrane protein